MNKEIFKLLPEDKHLKDSFIGWYWEEYKGKQRRSFLLKEDKDKITKLLKKLNN